MSNHFLKHSLLSWSLVFLAFSPFVETGHAQDFELEVIGFRGGLNSSTLGIPPTEKPPVVHQRHISKVRQVRVVPVKTTGKRED